jgi:Leucine-rich repeat (LRR) protein
MIRWIPACLLSLLLAACGPYDVKVNERVVFSPRPLFSDFDLADPALRACVEQAIADNNVTAASQLQVLNCSSAGIADLSGLGVFTGITRLKLSSNDIRNLVELSRLSLIQVLYLDDNAAVDPVPLYDLPALQELDLTGNAELQCPASSALLKVEKLTLPGHCTRR